VGISRVGAGDGGIGDETVAEGVGSVWEEKQLVKIEPASKYKITRYDEKSRFFMEV
jgi:hypothetical protein